MSASDSEPLGDDGPSAAAAAGSAEHAPAAASAEAPAGDDGEAEAAEPPGLAAPPSLERPDQLEAARVRAELRRKLFGVKTKAPQLGRYELREQIGAGAMGSVFVARDGELERDVALKVIRPRTSEEQARTIRRRLLREARAMAKLRHPNVVGVFEAGVVEDQAFIAMEYVRGSTLREWLQEKPRSWQHVLEVFAEAGRGLAAAHEADLVHRDFKPDNVLISGDGRVQVTDFGVARALETAEDGPASTTAPAGEPPATGTVGTEWARAGTPRYMAPEQHAGEEIDARTDQFAFCVALFEALFGEPPFRGATMIELAEAAQAGGVQKPTGTGRVPRSVYQAVLRGLRPDPAERFEDMAALLDALQPPAPPRRRWLLPLAAASVLGVGALAVAQLWVPEQSPAPSPTATATAEGSDEVAEVADAIGAALAAAARAAQGQSSGGPTPPSSGP